MAYVRKHANDGAKIEVLSKEDEVFSARHKELFDKEEKAGKQSPAKMGEADREDESRSNLASSSQFSDDFSDAHRLDQQDLEDLKNSNRMLVDSERVKPADDEGEMPRVTIIREQDGHRESKPRRVRLGGDSVTSNSSLSRFLGSLSPNLERAKQTVMKKLTGFFEDNESPSPDEASPKGKPELIRPSVKPKTEEELLEEHLAGRLLEPKVAAKLEKKEEFGKALGLEGKHKTLQMMQKQLLFQFED